MASTSQVVTRSIVVPAMDPPAATNHGHHAEKKKPYVRQLTDKRREQNRRAQKIYRERLRKRLEDLEEQAAATTSSSSSNPSDTASSKPQVNHARIMDPPRAKEIMSATRSIAAAAVNESSEYSQPRIINMEDAFVAAGDLPITQSQFTTRLRFDVIPSPPASEPEPNHTHDDYGDIDLRPIWPVPPRIGGKPYRPNKAPSSYNLAMTAVIPRRSQDSPPSSAASYRSAATANIYANNLRLVGVSTIEASIAVGLYLKITRSAYINDHPSGFPGCCVALNSDTLGPKSVGYNFFETYFAITPQLAEHIEPVMEQLKPSPAQMMNPHPCYLDCIVFPYFRDQTVQASIQGILDHEQLFLDIFHGGLVCWGGASDLANSRRSRKRQMKDNVAWNPRSWEAKKWFLRKYSWLTGTEEEEERRGDANGIWKGSRWWWNMRGDVDSDDDDNDDDAGEADDGEDPSIAENTTPLEFAW